MKRLEATGANAEQIDRWNGETGDRWADDAFRERQDRAQKPFGDAAMQALRLESGQCVLDIGCGSGSTTFELARRVGPAGRVLGVDVSTPQLKSARRRAADHADLPVEFVNGDVATLPFEGRPFDRAFSRFGVMFFSDPVSAFVHIRSGMATNGRMAFACWQPIDRNPWLANTLEVATRYLPEPEPVGPEEPGPFAFCDPDRIRAVIAGAGFAGVDVFPVESRLRFERDVASSVAQLVQYGPMGTPIAEAASDVRERILSELAERTRDYQTPDGVMIDGAVWVVAARCT